MITIAVTGHRHLGHRLRNEGAAHTEDAAWRWVAETFRDLLTELSTSPILVVSGLAAGADQRLAEIALARGAAIAAVVPSLGYETTFTASERATYERLMRRARAVTRLDFPAPAEEAYLTAGHEMVDRSDLVVAVWDGRAAEGVGGTGDIVAYARAEGRPVIQLNPITRSVALLAEN